MIDKSKQRSIAVTTDGSKTLFVPYLDEHYHSIHGAIQEAMHVFIQAGLLYFLEKNQPTQVRIFEMGFGTGLNACLTIEAVKNLSVQIEYHTIEAHPLTEVEIKELDYFQDENLQSIYQKVHKAPWNEKTTISENFSIHKKSDYIENWQSEIEIDVVYYDAFAPSAQPHLWEAEIFEKIYNSMSERGILVTYCAKGVVKRRMKSVGWHIEAIPGPPRKREMTRAYKNYERS